MSNLISGRDAVSSAVPAHIAERISDRPFDEDAQQAALEARVAKMKDAILEGDVMRSWAYDDYPYELVALVDHLLKTGASIPDIGIAAIDWLRDTAERQATREVEEQS